MLMVPNRLRLRSELRYRPQTNLRLPARVIPAKATVTSCRPWWSMSRVKHAQIPQKRLFGGNLFDLFSTFSTYNLHQLFSPFLLISSGHRLAQRLRVMHIRAPMIRGISVTLQADGINTQGFPKMDEGRHNGSSRYHCYENENKSI